MGAYCNMTNYRFIAFGKKIILIIPICLNKSLNRVYCLNTGFQYLLYSKESYGFTSKKEKNLLHHIFEANRWKTYQKKFSLGTTRKREAEKKNWNARTYTEKAKLILFKYGPLKSRKGGIIVQKIRLQ
jgi:hypothetical protein